MGKDCRVSKLCVTCVVLAVISVATIVTLWTIALTSGGGEDVTSPWDQYRLPKTLVPDHYNVSLYPRLTTDSAGLYIFTGKSLVVFTCVEETDLILIHSNKLNYTLVDGQLATLSAVGVSAAPTIKSSRLQTTTQYLVLQLSGKLTKGTSYQLDTVFQGELADDLAGFYRSEYNEDGERKIVATSQMHPTHARKTFPCFDEPAMKAVFHITLIHPPGTVALSNGKEQQVINVTVTGCDIATQTSFEPTERMSTYLLALIISDFSFLSSQEGDVQIRIWARRSTIAGGQGSYALNLTGPVLSFFEEYYNITYPLSKSDQIALPDFYFGAMENWGLVTYRETNLLYDPLTSSNSQRERTATIIAHELAHMWFGNLVTLRWWNEVWLNEGFASYVSYLGADKAEPAWNVKDLIVLADVHRVFAVDALASSHPLSSREDEIFRPEQIIEQFDVISYSKGAAVLRMLSHFLSEPVFVQGLSSYLKHFSYGNTVGMDLWDHLQMAVDATGTSLPDTTHNIMNRWVLQMGFPVVTIDTTSGQISQKHFLLDPDSVVTRPSQFNYEWMIPVTWMKSGMLQEPMWLMMKDDVNPAMEAGGEWILANLNVTGYYRVNYDYGNWERILLQLSTEHQIVPLINRAQLVDDAFNLARAKLVPTTLALRTTRYLSLEREYLPWQSAVDNLDYLRLMFDRTEVYGPMKNYIGRLVTPLFLHFKNMTSEWTEIPEGLTDQYNQVNAIRTACSTGEQECVTLTSGWYQQWMNNPENNPIHPNLRSAVYCSAMASGGIAEWEFGWTMFRNATVVSEADTLMSALACTTDHELLKRYLRFSLDPEQIRKQDASAVIVSVSSNVEGQGLAWDFLRENWTYMFTQYGVGSFSFASLITGVTRRFSTTSELEQLQSFQQAHSAVGFGSASQALEQALETTRANIRWVEDNAGDVLDWFLSETA
ncbi:aminopeptidase N-like [Osmerus mordax]|uniref:aminopeptidase N-like n=1 Tax=Osmerus mordax TaxID=8014 RepID=UPI00350F8316